MTPVCSVCTNPIELGALFVRIREDHTKRSMVLAHDSCNADGLKRRTMTPEMVETIAEYQAETERRERQGARNNG